LWQAAIAALAAVAGVLLAATGTLGPFVNAGLASIDRVRVLRTGARS
jgi:hypothetical protein